MRGTRIETVYLDGGLMLACHKHSLSQIVSLRRIKLMKTRLTLILIIAGAFVIGTLAPAASQSTTDKKLPEAHIYLHLFKHMVSLERRTEMAKQTGKNIDFTQWYEREAGLTPSQNEAFKAV